MTYAEEIVIVATGAVTSIGLSAASACAAVRSSMDNFSETHFIDEVGEPLLGAVVPPNLLALPEEADGSILGGAGKLAAMFVRAARECVTAGGGIDATRTALLLVGPELNRPGVTLARLQECFDACQTAVGKAFHSSSRITQIGNPGLVAALDYARELLSATHASAGAQKPTHPIQAVLVAGVDSFLNTEDINAALSQERLLTSQNSDGFIPGEGAVCLLVRRLSELAPLDSAGLPRPAVLRVAGAGLTQETESWESGRPNTGKALSKAMRMALQAAKLAAHEIHHRFSDASGKEFFMDESTYAWGRNLRAPSPKGYSSVGIGGNVGEIGAAMGPMLITIYLDMVRKGWSAGENALVNLSSVGEARAAVMLQSV
jgi:3-oxoacyl-[acyl-carrier-protein] synthase I